MRVVAFLFISALLVTGFAAAQTDGGTLPGTVYGTSNVRSGPDTRFPIVAQLAANERVIATGRDGDPARWLFVLLETGDRGWLPVFVVALEGDLNTLPIVTSDPIQPVNATPRPTLTAIQSVDSDVTAIAYGRVNVRSLPSIAGDVIGQLDLDDVAMVTARSNAQNDWLYIENSEINGWVAYFTVRVEGVLDDLPILVPDSSGEGLIPPSVLLQTRFNARLRQDPSLSSPTITIVPFSAEVTPLARTADSQWIYVGYEGLAGWGAVGLFVITPEALARLPIFVGGTPSPSPATPMPLPTPTPSAP